MRRHIIKNSIISFFITTSLFLVGCSNDSIANTDVKSNINTDITYTQENESLNDLNNQVKVHFIDTGNSDAVLIEEGDIHVLIDGGDNDDENLVVDYLKENNVDDIEYIIATHPHADHIGGLDAVIKSFDVENLLVANGSSDTKTYRDFINSAANKGINPSVPLENNKYKLGNSYFEVLNTNGGNDANEQSLVVMITNDNDKMLFMGDAEKHTESEILSKVYDVDLLKVGHHGSYSSSSTQFIDKINPEYAVILVGENNKYGHPHKETMDTLSQKNIEVHRSDECGDIVFISTGSGVTTDCNIGSYDVGANSKYSSQNETLKSSYQSNEKTIDSSSNINTNEVYWTPNGSVYHVSKNCSTLENSKTIVNGSIKESGKSRVCRVCGK